MPLRHSSGVLAIVVESDHRLQIQIPLGSFSKEIMTLLNIVLAKSL